MFISIMARDINYKRALDGYEKYKSEITSNSVKHNIDTSLIVAVIAYESNFREDAISYNRDGTTCNGLMQVRDGAFTPKINIRQGCSILSHYRNVLEDRGTFTEALLLTAYNMGAWHKQVRAGRANEYAKDVLRSRKKIAKKLNEIQN